MKKLLALILSLMLLLPLTAFASPAPAVSLAGLFSGLMQSSGSGVQFVSAPWGAFTTDDESVIGGVSDGSRMIVVDALGNIELWDEAAYSRLPLAFTHAEDAEFIASQCEMTAAMRIKKDQREEYQEKLRARAAEYLEKRGLDGFRTLSQIIECYGGGYAFGRSRCMDLNDRWAVVTHPAFGGMLVDMQEAAISPLPYGVSMFSLCGDQLLYSDVAGKGAVIDLTTGEETGVSLLSGVLGTVTSVTAVHLFPDGSKAVLARSEMVKDESTGDFTETDYYVMNAGFFGAVCVELGQARNMQSANTILVTGDGGYALAFSRNYAQINGSFVVDLQSRSVAKVEELTPVAGLESAFLLYDRNASGFGNNYLCTLDPGTLDKTNLSGSGGSDSKMWYISTFMDAVCAGGRLYSQSYRLQGYFTVEANAD